MPAEFSFKIITCHNIYILYAYMYILCVHEAHPIAGYISVSEAAVMYYCIFIVYLYLLDYCICADGYQLPWNIL